MKISTNSTLQRRRFELVKQEIPVLMVAKDLMPTVAGVFRQRGEDWRGTCPICSHGTHSGAFSVNPEKNLWHCHACGEGGDVIQLAKLAGGFDSAAMAVAWLGFAYGIDLPERPEQWYRKQTRQERVRADIERVRQESYRRRIFKYIIAPQITIEDPKEQREELKRAWEDLKSVPLRPHG